jgi:hypothetical protein
MSMVYMERRLSCLRDEVEERLFYDSAFLRCTREGTFRLVVFV